VKHGFLDRYSDLESPLHSLSAVAKVIVFFAIIVFVLSCRAMAYLSFGGYFVFLLVCLGLSHVPPIHVLRRSLMVIPFVAFAGISLLFTGASGGEAVVRQHFRTGASFGDHTVSVVSGRPSQIRGAADHCVVDVLHVPVSVLDDRRTGTDAASPGREVLRRKMGLAGENGREDDRHVFRPKL
jgi:energy-coupling factor transporter transmembrane protein EcfT